MTQVRTFSTLHIQPNPMQPRKHFDEQRLAELAADIQAHGLIQPIVVTNHPQHAGEFMIIAGERRWRAHVMAGISQIPALVKEGLSEQEIFELSTAENYSREDMLPLEESAAFERLHSEFGKSYGEIAKAFGVSDGLVRDRVRLLNLDPEIQALVNGGDLPLTTAVELARLTSGRQHQAVKAINEAGLTVSDSLALIGQLYEEQAQGTMFDLGAFFREKAREEAMKFLNMAKSTGQQLKEALTKTFQQLSIGELANAKAAIEALLAEKALVPMGAEEPEPEPQDPTLAELREVEPEKDELIRRFKGKIHEITENMRIRVIKWPTNNEALATHGRVEAKSHPVIVPERKVGNAWLPLLTITGYEITMDEHQPEANGQMEFYLDFDYGYGDSDDANRWNKLAVLVQADYQGFHTEDWLPHLTGSDMGEKLYREEE